MLLLMVGLAEKGDVFARIVQRVVVPMMPMNIRERAADFARFHLEPTARTTPRSVNGQERIRQQSLTLRPAAQSAGMNRGARSTTEAPAVGVMPLAFTKPTEIELLSAFVTVFLEPRTRSARPMRTHGTFFDEDIRRRRYWRDWPEQVSVLEVMRTVPYDLVLGHEGRII